MSAVCVDLLRRSARTFADREAVWCRGESLTFRELFDRSCRLANGLLDLGLAPQDRVALLGGNSLRSVEELTGLSMGNFVRVPLHARNTAHQHRYMLEHVRARALIVSEELYEPLAPHLEDLEALEHVIVHGRGGTVSYSELLGRADDADPAVPVAPDDISHVAFTSGTTGRPKAAVHTHGGQMGVTAQYTLALPRFDEHDRFLAVAPLSHAASTLFFTAVAAGATTVVEPKFDPDALAATLAERPVTFTLMVPTMIQALLDVVELDPARLNLGSVRALVSTGAQLHEATARRASEELGPILYNSYGQVEGVPAAMMTPSDFARAAERDGRKFRSVGRPGMLVRVRIVDDAGRDLPPYEHGEIAIDTPGNMRGYWEAPEASASRFLDGFVLTHDIGYLDDDGYLYVVDRKDDMIISGGFNIWPAEIEQAIAAHPDVVEVVVVGVPHPKWGQTPWAAVVVRQGATVSEAEIVDWCRERVGSMKKPTYVDLRLEPLPRSAVGKIPRRVVREELLARAPDSTTSQNDRAPSR
ncbi:class I adenylate-forming enzyme family protein [Georgenia halophila]|uniref:Class I adenylate-forming enzyme family protein n=1 Tax=Georgenia halophila TaxID=620889 RepID=A0ABP8LJT4_9MICO